jgi:hypothetical protein
VTNTADPVILDIDATLVEVHSENKVGTAPTFKRGFGFHPMLCFADATGQTRQRWRGEYEAAKAARAGPTSVTYCGRMVKLISPTSRIGGSASGCCRWVS